MKVAPISLWKRANSSSIDSRRWTSRLASGSSSSTTSGRIARQRASATRWRWPPDNSCGRRSAMPSSPTLASASLTQPHALGLGDPAHAQRKRDVLGDGHVRPQRIGLEHHADAPLLRRQRPAGDGRRPRRRASRCRRPGSRSPPPAAAAWSCRSRTGRAARRTRRRRSRGSRSRPRGSRRTASTPPRTSRPPRHHSFRQIARQEARQHAPAPASRRSRWLRPPRPRANCPRSAGRTRRRQASRARSTTAAPTPSAR